MCKNYVRIPSSTYGVYKVRESKRCLTYFHKGSRFQIKKSENMMSERPLGVSILAILQILGAIFLIVTGGLSLMAGLLFLLIPFWGILMVGLAAFMLIWGIIGLYIGFGLWNLKSWAYLVAMIFNIIAIIMAIANIFLSDILSAIISLIIPLIIVIYLYTQRDHFK